MLPLPEKTVEFVCKNEKCQKEFKVEKDALKREREEFRALPRNLRPTSKVKVCPSCGGHKVRKKAKADDIGKSKNAGKRMAEAWDRARNNEEQTAERDSTIEVGDFLSELATAIRYRYRTGLNDGDWLEEPERMFTDGKMFAEEQAVASDVKLQITLSLDASVSMWNWMSALRGNVMRVAGPVMMALDKTIRKAIQDLPEGTVRYAPFIFHETAHRIPASYLNAYVGRLDWATRKDDDGRAVFPIWPRPEQVIQARARGEVPPDTNGLEFKMSGKDTLLAPLFRAIQEWEQTGDSNATRLDIVITDGQFEDEDDLDDTSRIQEDRNGKLWTVLLNFLPDSDAEMPDRCTQYAVNPNNLETSIRSILSEVINSMLEN